MKLRTPQNIKQAVKAQVGPDAQKVAEWLIEFAEEEMRRGVRQFATLAARGHTQAVLDGAIELLNNAGWKAEYVLDQRDGDFVSISWPSA